MMPDECRALADCDDCDAEFACMIVQMLFHIHAHRIRALHEGDVLGPANDKNFRRKRRIINTHTHTHTPGRARHTWEYDRRGEPFQVFAARRG